VGRTDWILGQALFWVMVVAIVITAVVGIRRAGGMLTVHQAGLVGGRSRAGLEWGLVQAGSDLNTWWGIEPHRAGEMVVVEADPERRSLVVRVRGGMRTLFGGQADLGAGSFQRREDFYAGPPAQFE
jgi:hypothetical protein